MAYRNVVEEVSSGKEAKHREQSVVRASYNKHKGKVRFRII
jgi:hypothetical protein